MGGGRVDGTGGRLPSGWVHRILIGIDGLGVVKLLTLCGFLHENWATAKGCVP